MKKIIKTVAAFLAVSLLTATVGCSAIPGQPLTKNQETNELSPFNPGMGNWGWNANNQNGD